MAISQQARLLASRTGFDSKLIDRLVDSHLLLPADAGILSNPVLRQLVNKPIPACVLVFEQSIVCGVILPQHFFANEDASLLVSFDSLKDTLSTANLARVSKTTVPGKSDESRRIGTVVYSDEDKLELQRNSRTIALALEKYKAIPTRMLAEVITFVQFDLAGKIDLLPPNVDILMPYFAIIKVDSIKPNNKREVVPQGSAFAAYGQQGRHKVEKEFTPLLSVGKSPFPKVTVVDNNTSALARALLPFGFDNTKSQAQRIIISEVPAKGNAAAWTATITFPNSTNGSTSVQLTGVPTAGAIIDAYVILYKQAFGKTLSLSSNGGVLAIARSGAEAVRNEWYEKLIYAPHMEAWPTSLDQLVKMQNYKNPATKVTSNIVDQKDLKSTLVTVNPVALSVSATPPGKQTVYKMVVQAVEFWVHKPSGDAIAPFENTIEYNGGRLSDASVLKQVWQRALEEGYNEVFGGEGPANLKKLKQASAELGKPLYDQFDQQVQYGGPSSNTSRSNIEIKWDGLADSLNKISLEQADDAFVFPLFPVYIRPTLEPVIPYPWMLAPSNAYLDRTLNTTNGNVVVGGVLSNQFDDTFVAQKNEQPIAIFKLPATIDGVVFAGGFKPGGKLHDDIAFGKHNFGNDLSVSTILTNGDPDDPKIGYDKNDIRTQPIPAIGWKDSYVWNTVESNHVENRVLCGNDAFIVTPPVLDKKGKEYVDSWVEALVQQTNKGKKLFSPLATAAKVREIFRAHVQTVYPSLICHTDGSEWSVAPSSQGQMAQYRDQLNQMQRGTIKVAQQPQQPKIDFKGAPGVPTGLVDRSGQSRIDPHQTYLQNMFPDQKAYQNNSEPFDQFETRRWQAALPMRYWLRGPYSTIGTHGLLCNSILFNGVRGKDSTFQAISAANDATNVKLNQMIAAEHAGQGSNESNGLRFPTTTIPDTIDGKYLADGHRVKNRTLINPFFISAVLPFFSNDLEGNSLLDLVVETVGGSKIFGGKQIYDITEVNGKEAVDQARRKIPYPSTFHFDRVESSGYASVGSFVIPPEFSPRFSVDNIQSACETKVRIPEMLRTRSEAISSVGSDLFNYIPFVTGVKLANHKGNRIEKNPFAPSDSRDPNLYALFVAAKLIAKLHEVALQGDSSFHVDIGEREVTTIFGDRTLVPLRDTIVKHKQKEVAAAGFDLDRFIQYDQIAPKHRVINVVTKLSIGGRDADITSDGHALHFAPRTLPGLGEGSSGPVVAVRHTLNVNPPVYATRTGDYKSNPMLFDSFKDQFFAHSHSGMIATILQKRNIWVAACAPIEVADVTFRHSTTGFFNLAVGKYAKVNLGNADGTVLAHPVLQKAEMEESRATSGQFPHQQFTFPFVKPQDSIINAPTTAQYLSRPFAGQVAEMLDGWMHLTGSGHRAYYAPGIALATEMLAKWRQDGDAFIQTDIQVDGSASFTGGDIADRKFDQPAKGKLAKFPVPLATYVEEEKKLNAWIEQTSRTVQRMTDAPPSSFYLGDPTANALRSFLRYTKDSSKILVNNASVDFSLQVQKIYVNPIAHRLMVPKVGSHDNFYLKRSAAAANIKIPQNLNLKLIGGIYGTSPSYPYEAVKKKAAHGASFYGTEVVVTTDRNEVLYKDVIAAGDLSPTIEIPLSALTVLAEDTVVVKSRQLLSIIPQHADTAFIVGGRWSFAEVAIGDLVNETTVIVEQMHLDDDSAIVIPRLTKNVAGENIVGYQLAGTDGSSFKTSRLITGKASSVDQAGNLSSAQLMHGGLDVDAPKPDLYVNDVALGTENAFKLRITVSPELQSILLKGQAAAKQIKIAVNVNGSEVVHTTEIKAEVTKNVPMPSAPLLAPWVQNVGAPLLLVEGRKVEPSEAHPGSFPQVDKLDTVFGRQDQVKPEDVESNVDIITGELPLTEVTVPLALIK